MRRTSKHDLKNVHLLAAQKNANQENDALYSEVYDYREAKQNARRQSRYRRKRLLMRVLLLICAVLLLLLFFKSNYFAIKDIKVEGMNYYTGAEIIGMSGVKVGDNLIFDSRQGDIKEALKSNPYFKEVSIKRKLPSTLIIQVEERPQTAGVIFGEGFIVIDDEGTVLRRTDVDPKLTLLTGLTISKMTVGEKLEAEESDTLSITLRMLDIMKNGNIYFKKIDVAKVVIKAYIYDNLIVKGTPGEMAEAIEKGDLQKVVTDLFAEGISRGTIKMGGSSYISFSPEIEDD